MYNLHDNTKLMVLAGKLAYLGSRVPESESYLTALDILAGYFESVNLESRLEEIDVQDLDLFTPTRMPHLIVGGDEIPCAPILNSPPGEVQGTIGDRSFDRQNPIKLGYFTNRGSRQVVHERQIIAEIVWGPRDYISPLPQTRTIGKPHKRNRKRHLSEKKGAEIPKVMTQWIDNYDNLTDLPVSLSVESERIRTISNLVVDVNRSAFKEAPTVYIVAHLDSVPFFDATGEVITQGNLGVADNISGLVHAIKLAENFANADMEYNIRLLVSDAEEYGHWGSILHFYNLKGKVLIPKDNIPDFAINLDTVVSTDTKLNLEYYCCHPFPNQMRSLCERIYQVTRKVKHLDYRNSTDAMTFGLLRVPVLDVTSEHRVRIHTLDDNYLGFINPDHLQSMVNILQGCIDAYFA